jgi:hypothetical protein
MTAFTCLRRMFIPIGLAAVVLTTSLAVPAYADTVTTQRSATVEWLQTGQISGVGGNVHVGRVQFSVPAASPTPVTLYGEMFDYTCPAGYLPDGLWLDAIAQLDANCDIQDNLIIQSGDLTLNVGGKLHSAHLVGEMDFINTFVVGSGSFAVNLRWAAPGDKTVTRSLISPHPRTVLVQTTRTGSVVGTIGSATIGVGDQASSGVIERDTTIQHS